MLSGLEAVRGPWRVGELDVACEGVADYDESLTYLATEFGCPGITRAATPWGRSLRTAPGESSQGGLLEDSMMDAQMVINTVGQITMAVRDEMERLEEQHSCILTAAVLTEVLHRKGYKTAYTLRVSVKVVNQAFVQYIELHGTPKTPEEMARFDAAGAATIILGDSSAEALPEGRWPGHTVVILPGVPQGAHLMSDTTITQVNRADIEIEVPPILAVVRDDFLNGQKPLRRTINGCVVSYTALPGDREHETTELWKSRVGIVRVAEAVLARI